MATPETQNIKSVAPQTKKKNFSGYLRAVEAERFNPANNPDRPLFRNRRSYAADDAFNARLLQITGIAVSAMWLIGAGVYIQRTVGWNNVSGLLPHEMGGFLAGILSPIALFWMVAAFIMRSNDVKRYAEALREEIKVMIFPSDEADRRVNNDIERLMRQTAEMSKATRMALAAIESAREGVRSQVHVLNDSSELTVDRLDALSQALSQRMQDVAEMSKHLDASIQTMESRTEQAVARMDTGRQQLDNTVEKISGTSENAELSIARLSDMLRDRLDALGNLHKETENALQNASQEMETQRKDLRIEAEAIEEKAYAITDALKTSTNRLYEFSDDALDKAKLIETRLTGQTASLQQAVNQSHENTTALLKATERASEDAQKIESVLQGAIDRLEERAHTNVNQVQELMTGATKHLVAEVEQISERAQTMTDTMLTEVNRKVMDTTSAFAYIQKQIQALVTLFDERKLHLDNASLSARETADTMSSTLQLALDKVSETTTALQKGVGVIHESLQQPITLLEDVAKMAYQRAGDIGQLLEDKATHLTDTAHKMSDHVQQIQNQLQGRGQDVALIAGKIAGHLKTVTHELEQQNELLDNRLGKSVQALDSMHQANKIVVDNLGKLQEQSTLSSETIEQRIGILRQLQKALADESEDATDKVSRLSDRMVNVSTGTVDKIKNTIENMTLLEADYHRLSDAGVDDIQRLETGYRQLLQNVQSETAQANDMMTGQLSSIQKTAQDVIEAGKTINVETSRIQELGEAANTTLQTAIDMSKQFDDRLSEGGRTISVHVSAIEEAMAQMQSRALHTVEALAQQEQNLEQQVQTQVARLTQAGQYFIETASKVKDEVNDSFEQTDALVDKMNQTLGRTQDAMGQSVSGLMSYADQINQTTTQLLEQIDLASQNFATQASDLRMTNDNALERLQDATNMLGGNAAALERAAKAAQQQADLLRQQESKLNRDAFFNSAKFVVESLHSLALDFTRMLEGELHDKTWKAYQKGDVAAFTRRLLNARDAETQSKIETKFKDDVEFRTYVQRYLRQFEEVYDSASNSDHGDLLTSIFTTSDVGKLYQFLCNTLERDSRIKSAA